MLTVMSGFDLMPSALFGQQPVYRGRAFPKELLPNVIRKPDFAKLLKPYDYLPQRRSKPLAANAVHDIPDLLKSLCYSIVIDFGFLPWRRLPGVDLYNAVLSDPQPPAMARQ